MTLAVTQTTVTESPTPSPDGVTVNFNTSVAYQDNTVSVWRNGRRIIAEWDDGFTEGGGTVVTMNEAPLTGDTIQVEYQAL